MLNMGRNGVVSGRRWKSDSGIDLCPSDSHAAHVLAVDDNLIDRKVIEKLLKTSSCRVTAVDSGLRALQFLGLDQDQRTSVIDDLKVDLIITDYCMPGMTGFELLQRIKKSSTFKETPVVIMSSENVLTRIDRCLEEGAEAFLIKPVKSCDVEKLKDYLTKEDKSNGREREGINKRKQRDGSDLTSQSPPSSRSPSSDSSSTSSLSSSDLQSVPSISSLSSPTSPLSSMPSSPSGPLDDSPSSPSSPSGPLDSPIREIKINEDDVINKS